LIIFNNYTYSFQSVKDFLKNSNYETLKTIILSNSFFGKIILEDLMKQVLHPNKVNKSIQKYDYFEL
jgi:hypothetical protein